MSNLLDTITIVRNELQKQGVPLNVINTIVCEENIEQTLLLRLPNSCIVLSNKRGGGHQTHIHVTGEGMEMFYSSIIIAQSQSPIADTEVEVELFKHNLLFLNQRNIDNKENVAQLKLQGEEPLLHSKTYKKLSVRSAGGKQVQLSKTTIDGKDFIHLRNNLFEGDALVFLKPFSECKYLAVAIPYLSLPDGIENAYHVSENKKTLEKAMKDLDDPQKADDIVTGTRKLKRVDSHAIANYSEDEINNGEDSWFNLGESIERRKQRTTEHQKIVKVLAYNLSKANFYMFESAIDCLAVKPKMPVLIFEVKTLSDKKGDERNQVLKAFAQLYYYEEFKLEDFAGHTTQKIALFSKKPTDKNIAFLEKNMILVMWINMLHQLDGSETTMNRIKLYGI